MKKLDIINKLRGQKNIPDGLVEELHQLMKESGAVGEISAARNHPFSFRAIRETCPQHIDSQILEEMYFRYIAEDRRPILTYSQYLKVVKGLSGQSAA